MILKALTLENFKGIREPVRIEFSPITLLFGPNNAGKSTVLHALIYARELFERGNADPRSTQMGGDTIDLGGFDGLVFGNDRSRRIRMRFEFEVSAAELIHESGNFIRELLRVNDDIQRWYWDRRWEWQHKRKQICPDAVPSLERIVDRHPLKWLEITIGWSEQHQRPLVLSCSIGEQQPDQPSLELTLNQGSNAVELTRLDLGTFPLGKIDAQESMARREEISRELEQLSSSARRSNPFPRLAADHEMEPQPALEQFRLDLKEWEERDKAVEGQKEQLENAKMEAIAALSDFLISTPDFLRGLIRPEYLTDDGQIKPLPAQSGLSALPERNHWLSLTSFCHELDRDVHDSERPNIFPGGVWAYPRTIVDNFLDPLINTFLSGFVNCCRSFFKNSLYLSAIRVVPPRDFHPVHPVDSQRWSSGLAAWDLLYAKETELLGALNAWLSDDRKRFSSGFQVEVQHTKQLDVRQSPIAELLISTESISLDHLREHILALPEQRLLRIRNLATGALGHPRDIGYGLSQLLPVVVAALDTKSGIVSVEEPESNIHPALQVVLADLFITQAKANPDALFLIETHSEHLMLRCLRRIRETSIGKLAEGEPSLHPDDIAVHFVEPVEGSPRFHRIRIDEEGEFLDPWPRGFFSERMTEVYGNDL